MIGLDMKKLLFVASLLILSCSETPSEPENNFNDIDLNVEMNRDTYFSDYHTYSVIEVTNQSPDTAYLFSGGPIQIQKRINGSWVSLPLNKNHFSSFNYPILPGGTYSRGIHLSKFKEFSSENSINGEYRLKVVICDVESSDPCPTQAADDEIFSNTFIVKNRDIPYADIDPRIEQVDVDVTLSKYMLSYSEDNAVSVSITNNSDFPVYLSDFITQFQRYLDNEWVDGLTGTPGSGVWFIVDGAAERYRLDPGETYEGFGGRNPTLALSVLNNTIGDFRFELFQLCIDKPTPGGACPTPVLIEDKVSETFTLTE